MNHNELRQKFNAWMAENFTPSRKVNGGVRTRGGVTVYDDIARLRPLLSGSFVEACERFRRGEDVASGVTAQIEEIVFVQDVEKIRQLRIDQSFEQRLDHAVLMHKKFGCAPDGGDIRAWSVAVRLRLGAGLTKKAAHLWPESPANMRRRNLLKTT